MRHFWGAWEKLSINSGLLLKGTRVFIPLELLNCTLVDLHGEHQGINRMQAQVREAVYWPSIDADITDYVFQCTICTKHKASPPHLCYLEISLMAHGRRLLLITSPIRVESAYWCAIHSASTPSCIKFPPNQPYLYVYSCKSSYLNMDCLVWSTLCPTFSRSNRFHRARSQNP